MVESVRPLSSQNVLRDDYSGKKGSGGEVNHSKEHCRSKKPLKPLSANPTKWSNTFKQFVGKLPTNCLRVFDHFVKLALKGLVQK